MYLIILLERSQTRNREAMTEKTMAMILMLIIYGLIILGMYNLITTITALSDNRDKTRAEINNAIDAATELGRALGFGA